MMIIMRRMRMVMRMLLSYDGNDDDDDGDDGYFDDDDYNYDNNENDDYEHINENDEDEMEEDEEDEKDSDSKEKTESKGKLDDCPYLKRQDGYDCKACGKRYKNLGSMKTHMVKNHGIVNSVVFVCKSCTKSFDTQKKLTRHQNSKTSCCKPI